MKETNPPVQHMTQPKSNLCWATCIRMMRDVVKKKPNHDITPVRIAQIAFYEDAENANVAGKDHVIKSVIEHWAGPCKYVARAITWTEVINNIDNNKPILIGYGWNKGKDGGHVMVIGGYEPKGDKTWGFVRLFDPLRPEYKDLSHDALINGNYDPDGVGGDRGHIWDATWILE